VKLELSREAEGNETQISETKFNEPDKLDFICKGIEQAAKNI
jgi:hypothetical protein